METFLSKGKERALASARQMPRDRGTPVDVHPEWLDLLKDARGRMPRAESTYEALGQALARAIGRPKAWGKTQVGNYLTGKVVTKEMTEAFSRLYGLRYPIMAAANEEEVAWFELGRRLRRLDHDHFIEILRDEGEWAMLEERRLERRRQMERARNGGNPQ